MHAQDDTSVPSFTHDCIWWMWDMHCRALWVLVGVEKFLSQFIYHVYLIANISISNVASQELAFGHCDLHAHCDYHLHPDQRGLLRRSGHECHTRQRCRSCGKIYLSQSPSVSVQSFILMMRKGLSANQHAIGGKKAICLWCGVCGVKWIRKYSAY